MKKLLVSVQDFRRIAEESYAPDFSETSSFRSAMVEYPSMSAALSKCADWVGYDDEREEIEEVIQFDIRYSFMLAMQAVITRLLSEHGVPSDNLTYDQVREGGIEKRGDAYYVSCDASLVYRLNMKSIGVTAQFEFPVADWTNDDVLAAAIQKLQDGAFESYSKHKERFDAAIQAEREFKEFADSWVRRFRAEANLAYFDFIRSSASDDLVYPSDIDHLFGSAHQWLHEDVAPSLRLSAGIAVGVSIQRLVTHLLTTRYGVHPDNIRTGIAAGNVDYKFTDSVCSSQAIYATCTGSVDSLLGTEEQRIDARIDFPIERWNDDLTVKNVVESVVKTVEREVNRSRSLVRS